MDMLSERPPGGILLLALCINLMSGSGSLQAREATMITPVNIGSRLEMFVDQHLVEHMDGVGFRLHEPQAQPLPANPLPIAYSTVIRDGDLYRAYYRDYRPGYEGPKNDGNAGEITCYAESRDGHEWSFPDLGITDVRSSRGGNVILAGAAPCSHNFSPFLDARPGVEPEARFKALAGTHPGGGLYAFRSADGVRWERIRDVPVMTSRAFAFDSQNVAFWSAAEGRYVCYFRTGETPHGRLRTISRATSDDFISWSDPVAMNPNRPGEHLYTSQTHPYFRAPHIYIALPTRFMPDRGASTDVLFMATRAGATAYTRLFAEAFIRPGLDPDRWGNRSNYVALNVVPTGPAEMSIYHKSGHRYTLRTDGFVSVGAGGERGTLLTRPLAFSGNALTVNYSTAAAGSLRVGILNATGKPLPGFTLDDCPEMVGDSIAQRAAWRGSPDLGALAGTPVRLRFELIEGDLYSFRFGDQ